MSDEELDELESESPPPIPDDDEELDLPVPEELRAVALSPESRAYLARLARERRTFILKTRHHGREAANWRTKFRAEQKRSAELEATRSGELEPETPDEAEGFLVTETELESAIDRAFQRSGLFPIKGVGGGSGGQRPPPFVATEKNGAPPAAILKQSEYEKLTPKQAQEILEKARGGWR